MKDIFFALMVSLVLIGGSPGVSLAQNEKKRGMPSANVVVSRVTTGTIAPEQEFIGTLYYPEVSNVSAEVSGRVEIITFEEGQRMQQGETLIRLNTDLLEKRLQAGIASYEQTLSDLERAKKDFERMENLYAKRIVAQKDYDDQMFQVRGLEKKSAALKAEVDRLK